MAVYFIAATDGTVTTDYTREPVPLTACSWCGQLANCGHHAADYKDMRNGSLRLCKPCSAYWRVNMHMERDAFVASLMVLVETWKLTSRKALPVGTCDPAIESDDEYEDRRFAERWQPSAEAAFSLIENCDDLF